MFIENGCKFYELGVDDISEIDFEEGNPIFEKDGFCYLKETGELFTGIVISDHCGGFRSTEDHYKNGLKHGKSIWWDDDGFILEEGNYKNGEKFGEIMIRPFRFIP